MERIKWKGESRTDYKGILLLKFSFNVNLPSFQLWKE